MTGTNLNLSLLSRGVGEVHKNGHERVDVYLEPEDYHNFSGNRERLFLPPIRTSYSGPHFFEAAAGGRPSHPLTARTSRDMVQEFRVPKTFTTRKGALLLFSEDLAQRNTGQGPDSSRPHHHHDQKTGTLSAFKSITPASSLDSQVYLKTVEDLAQSILKYGDQDRPETGGSCYLKFVHARRDNITRQIRPGYSAKRYLSTWSRTWDDTVFDNVIKQGFIAEKSLYQYNLVLPHMRRRLFYEDLSHMPQPYRLMRNMLLMPGSLSGYTFYRAPTVDFDEEDGEQDTVMLRKRPDTNLRNIRVIKTKGGIQEEVAYSDLDRQSQREVITDLLVKSAVHYALKKQEEIYEEGIIRAVKSGQDGLVTDGQVVTAGAAAAEAHEFDMRDAVESLLDSQNGRYAIGGDLPEIDDRSHSSEMTGSFKGGALPRALVKQHQAARPAWPAESVDADKEYMGGVPIASVKSTAGGGAGGGSATAGAGQGTTAATPGEVSAAGGFPGGVTAGPVNMSGVPVLPPIRHTLSPIRDVSRETTQHNMQLPSLGRDGHTSSGEVPAVHIQPATPQHSVLTGGSASDVIANRGLASRDTAEVLPELAEEDTIHEGTEKSPSKMASEASAHTSSERERAKTLASDSGQPAESVVHPAAAPSGTGTSQTGKSRPSWKGGLRKGPGSQVDSVRGSMVMAPDGEIISVGGSLTRGGAVYDVGNINDVVIPHRHEGGGTDESGLSDDEPDEWRTAKRMSIRSIGGIGEKKFKRGSATSGSSVSREDWDKLSSAGRGLLIQQAGRVSESGSRKSSVTEKDIMDTLTDHAQRIAESVLSHPNAGEDLENDVKKAAEMWTELHPPRPISRRASVSEARAEAIAEIMRNRRASSAAPSAAEYRNLIKKSLTEAAAKSAGIDPSLLNTDDAEVSPELLEALASQKVSPDQIEVVSDSSGRTRIQSRADLQGAMGGVEEGHIYIAPGKKGEDAMGKRQTSIPADKVSVMDDMEFDRISYQGTDVASEKGEKRGKSKAGSKPGSIAGGTMADLTELEGVIAAIDGKVEGQDDVQEPEDDFLKAVRQAEGVKPSPSPERKKPPSSGVTTPSGEGLPAAAAPAEVDQKVAPPTLPPDTGPQEIKPEDIQSQKSGKTGVSQKSEASKDSKKKGKKSPEEKEEPFVVGKVDQKGELEKLYGPVEPPPQPPAPPKQEEPPAGLVDHKKELQTLYGSQGGAPPPAPPAAPKAGSPKGKPKEKKPKKEPPAPKKDEKKPKKGKKGKKGKKKEEEAAVVAPAASPQKEATPPPPPPPEPPVVQEPTPRKDPTPAPSEPKASSPEYRTDDSDLEFNFVREQSSPEVDPPQHSTRLAIPPSPPLDEEDEEKSDDGGEDDNNLKSISNREARAAKRAAAAAKRREEVERRRKEKEDLARKEKEEMERKIALQKEMEDDRRRREEERMLRKQLQKEQEEKELREKSEAERRLIAEAERERRQKEEYQRKLEDMKRKQAEEELRRQELLMQKRKEEEERRLAEEELMSQMAEQERKAYEEKKRLEEEERIRKEKEDRLRREEEAKKAMEEARRLAEEMARKQAELEARLKFNKALQEEAQGLGHSQEINRAFVFSYFELLQWLGLDIPEFELAKLADY